MAHQFQMLATMFTATQSRLSLAANPERDQDPEELKRIVTKLSLQYTGLHSRSCRNLQLASWEPNFRYIFPQSVYADLLEAMQR
jgi:hypothetical protein